MNANAEPKLAPPGAGLPRHELFVGRLLFALRRWTGSRDSFNARFQQEREAIHRLVCSCEGDSGARRVLIRRPRGMEDSSRYWSVWMTLDHLRIVNGGFTRVIAALTKGVVPKGTASTATVKPSPHANATVVAEYEKSCDDLLATVAAAGNLNTAERVPAGGVHGAKPGMGVAHAGGHMGIHRVSQGVSPTL